jgi:VWFA-related protein
MLAQAARLSLCLTLMAASTLPQQQQQQEEPPLPSIQVDVDVVNILASVRDKKGALISTLTQDDFTIFEDGRQQTIKYFARETELPLTIGLLVDVSASQENLLETEKRAAYQFFSKVLTKKDVAFLISFGSEAELLQDLTGSPRLLQLGLEKLRINSAAGGLHPGPVPTMNKQRGTVLHDAVYLAATDRLTGEVGRKAIVLITDGVDMGSRLKLEEAIEAAQKADAVIYSIYYTDPSAYGGFYGGGSDSALKKMSEETGGRVFRADRKGGLDEAFRQLQEEMRSQYAIGYTPVTEGVVRSAKQGDFRKLEVRTRDKNLRVQARKGYYAKSKEAAGR